MRNVLLFLNKTKNIFSLQQTVSKLLNIWFDSFFHDENIWVRINCELKEMLYFL